MSPKQKRWRIKRKLDQSMAALDKSVEILGDVAKEYEEPHPEIFEALLSFANHIRIIRALIEPIRDRI